MKKKFTYEEILKISKSDLSYSDLSKKYKCNPITIFRNLKNYNLKKVKTSRTGKYRWKERGKYGKNHHSWKGGKTNIGSYIKIYCLNHPFAKDNYVLEHRLIMERHLGRYLLPQEIVHHINGNTQDNRIENLILFSSRGKHLSSHYPKGKPVAQRWKEEDLKFHEYIKYCNGCGKRLEIKTKRDIIRKNFCSRKCQWRKKC